MAPVGTLWGYPLQSYSKVILSVAALNGFELEQPEWVYTNKPADFTAKFAYGKIPAFEGSDGFKVTESTPIARYLSSIGEINLLGSTTKETATIEQWVHFAEHEIGVPSLNTLGLIYGFAGSFNLETIDKNAEHIARALDHLEAHLATCSSGYVALDTLTLADLVLASEIYLSAYASLGSAERAKYPKVFAYYERVTADERLKQYWGTEKFTEVRVTEPKTLPIS